MFIMLVHVCCNVRSREREREGLRVIAVFAVIHLLNVKCGLVTYSQHLAPVQREQAHKAYIGIPIVLSVFPKSLQCDSSITASLADSNLSSM